MLMGITYQLYHFIVEDNPLFKCLKPLPKPHQGEKKVQVHGH